MRAPRGWTTGTSVAVLWFTVLLLFVVLACGIEAIDELRDRVDQLERESRIRAGIQLPETDWECEVLAPQPLAARAAWEERAEWPGEE